MSGLKWTDADEVACRLHETRPQTDPLTVRFAELREMVLALEGFEDAPAASNEPILEAIQIAWLGYFRDEQ